MVASYPGTLLLVSHDRAFIDNVVTSTLVFEGDAINEYVGGYSDWLRQRKPAPARQTAAPKTITSATPDALKPRRLSYKEQRELAQLPQMIERLEAEQLQLSGLIGDPTVFQRNREQATAALQRLQGLAAELESAYARWAVLDEVASEAG
jgi:ATP-binding cassette subfamily F protein uup